MQKGTTKILFGDKSTDNWVEGKIFIFRINKGWHLRPYYKSWLRMLCPKCNPWKDPWPAIWESKKVVTRPYFSFRIWGWGFYIGWKIYELNDRETRDVWAVGLDYPDGSYLAFSIRPTSGEQDG